MALFPDATFNIFFPSTGVVAGTRAEGQLKLDVPSDIPRAEHIHLFWKSQCIAGYGSGKHRRVLRRDVFFSPLELKLDPSRPLLAGSYSYPFAVDLPAWLPPSYGGNDCSIIHEIQARLSVDWAIDPTATVSPHVRMPPTDAVGKPIVTRSPAGFHESLVIELTLDRNCVVEGEPITGRIALRGGHDARFDALNVAIASMATIQMGRGDRRRGHGSMARIPAEYLRRGQSVPFAITYDSQFVRPTFRNGFIDHDIYLVVEADIPWATDPSFEFPIQIVPFGSRVHVDAPSSNVVGTERLWRLAAAMSAATGLAQGRLPTLVEGKIGPVGVVIADAPSEGRIGVNISFDFPDLGLGATFRPLGMLEGLRQSPLLPSTLADNYLLRTEPEIPVADDALRAFFADVLAGFTGTSEVRFSDHQLSLRQPLADDGGDAMTALAQWTRGRAEVIARAIGRLPFNAQHAAAAPAWTATAGEQSAFLLPHLPALTGMFLSSRIVGGEQRTIGVELRARSNGTIAAELDLRSVPLPRAAWPDLEKQTDLPGLRPVRAVFQRIDVYTIERIALEGAPFAPDPRALLSTVEIFFWWLLEARGERRADAPYR